MTEKEASKEIRELLKRNGWFVIRNQQNIGSTKGIADFVVMKRGITIWIEVKGQKGKISESQVWFRDRLAEAGCRYVLAWSAKNVENYIIESFGENLMNILLPVEYQKRLVNQLEFWHEQGHEKNKEVPQGTL